MKSKLSNKGYVIMKDEYSDKELKKIKKELNVSPYSPYQSKFSAPPSFPIYLESKRKLYLPRYWSLDNLGPPEKFCINEGTSIDIKFNGSLRPVQEEASSAYMKNCYPEYGGGILCLGCGQGKCMGRDTPVIMYDGTIKMIQDVKIGDQLMGDDSTPRNVLNLGRGMEMMYDIVPTKGDTYTVNESHILSLKYSTHKNKNVRKGDVIDIPLKDYMNLPPSYHGRGGNLLGYRVGVDFPYKEVDIDPYFLGYWLGDGNSRNTGITTIEKCVVDYYENYAKSLDLHIRKSDSNKTRCPTYHASGNRGQGNKLLKMLKKHNLVCNKHIPHIYKCNSREIRLQLLAGILDSDGSNSQNSYDIIQKNETLLDDIIYLARSLGFACYKKECKKSCIYNGEKKEGIYYRTCIHGKGLEEIPVKCERKKVQPRRQIKDALTTRIKVVPKGVDYYYGVELDGNHRYLLGDYTVTHNTVIGLNIASQLKKKTLIIVHKEFLLNQWIERIKMFLPDAQVGRIQAKTFDIAGKDIVIGMLQSLSMKEFEENAFDSFGTVIIDECHHISSEVFSRALPKVSFKYTIGLTATPNRTDGLTKVFEWFLGPIVYKSKGGKQHNVFVKVIQIDDTNESYCKVEEGYDGKPITSRMINNVANYIPRTSVIIREVQKIMEEPGRKMLILSDRREHLKYIHTQLTEKGFDVGFYVGGMKQKDLDISETKPIILGTFSMSSEALDIPELNTLFMTTPKSNIEQSVGRILRKTHEIRPLIIDIKDNFRPFASQCNKRKTFYKKCKYEIYDMKVKPNEMEEILEKNKNIHNMTCNIIDDLNKEEIKKSKKESSQAHLEEFMLLSDDD